MALRLHIAAASVFALSAAAGLSANPKYTILFIGDGMSVPQRMIAEEYSRKTGRGPLAMNSLPVQGSLRTCPSNALITDSAAAATALACGVKSYNQAIGVDAKGRPVESCAEIARKAGRKVGMVTTVTITHATPAGFYAHCRNRGQVYHIATDLARSGFDFFAGGGLYKPVDKKSSRWKECGEAYAYAGKLGYRNVRTRDEFLALKPGDGKILATFSKGYMAAAIDAKAAGQPTLAEMTAKALEMLDGPDGFFLMVEGGLIDHAGHANDAAANLRETIAMDDAFNVALGFLEKHPDETLVVATGDHETGGLSMGFSGSGYSLHPERLALQKASVDKFSEEVREMMRKNPGMKFDDIKPFTSERFGFKFAGDRSKDPMVLSEHATGELKSAFDADMKRVRAKVSETKAYDARRRYMYARACVGVMARRAGIAWGSGNHTALPVMVTAKGVDAEKFGGFMENDEFGRRLKALCAK